jgi:hypothetical protein
MIDGFNELSNQTKRNASPNEPIWFMAQRSFLKASSHDPVPTTLTQFPRPWRTLTEFPRPCQRFSLSRHKSHEWMNPFSPPILRGECLINHIEWMDCEWAKKKHAISWLFKVRWDWNLAHRVILRVATVWAQRHDATIDLMGQIKKFVKNHGYSSCPFSPFL